MSNSTDEATVVLGWKLPPKDRLGIPPLPRLALDSRVPLVPRLLPLALIPPLLQLPPLAPVFCFPHRLLRRLSGLPPVLLTAQGVPGLADLGVLVDV